MRIYFDKIPLEELGFNITEKVIGGDLCYLVVPKPTTFDWTLDTLKFRSSIWTKDGELISASYAKFFNLEENPAIFPFTDEIQDWTAVEKIDGSALIVSKYKGELIIRTRGTFDARQMANGNEVDLFLETNIGKFLANHPQDTFPMSFIFEWVTPNNQIVINYGPNVRFYLTGIVNHPDYTLVPQAELDEIAKEFKCLRPITYKFKVFSDLCSEIKKQIGKEGVCVYYSGDNCIRKIKSFHYLKLHAFRSNCSPKNIMELILEQNYPSQEEFLSYIEHEFDFECRLHSETNVKECYSILECANELVIATKNYVDSYPSLSQKDFALSLINEPLFIHNPILKAIAFKLRRNESVVDLKKKFIKQLLRS